MSTVTQLGDVQKHVRRIASYRGDPEVAHSEEKQLWENVLKAIAAGMDGEHRFSAVEMARLADAALKTREVKFDRWFA